MLDAGVKPPKHIELLETLTIFGVKAQYMEDFKSYLEQEGTPTNKTVHEFRLPVISRFNEVKEKKLHVIKVKDGVNFKQQARRQVLKKTDQGFLRYLLKSKDEWSNYDLEMWTEMEGVMREKYGIPENSIFRFYNQNGASRRKRQSVKAAPTPRRIQNIGRSLIAIKIRTKYDGIGF